MILPRFDRYAAPDCYSTRRGLYPTTGRRLETFNMFTQLA